MVMGFLPSSLHSPCCSSPSSSSSSLRSEGTRGMEQKRRRDEWQAGVSLSFTLPRKQEEEEEGESSECGTLGQEGCC